MSFLVSAAASAATAAATAGTAAAAATTIGAAATAAGAGTAGAVGGLAAGIGAGAATAGALGAGVGAISAAAQGQDVGKGALMGAAGGVATAGVAGGVGAALGPAAVGGTQAAIQGAAQGIGNVAAGAAGGATSAAVGGQDVGKGAMIGAGTAAAAQAASGLAGGISPAASNASGEFGTIKPDFSSVGAAHDPGVLDSLAKGATDLTGSSISGQGVKAGLAGLGGAVMGDYAGHSMVNADEAAKKASQQNAQGAIDFANQNEAGMSKLKGLGFGASSGPLSSLGSIGKATGGLTALAHGGQIPLKDGAYIIPADVVSALGNGSSKAGAEFLRHLMMEVRKEAVNIQGLGAAKKHAS